MWFQDVFNYDFRRTEQCIIPYATQVGEISFCAYNTGVGWRNIIEKMHMTATLTNEEQHDLDRLGIAKNSREEKIRARAAKIKAQEENDRMMKLYRQHVLKEQPTPELVPPGAIKPAKPVEEREVGSFGD